MKRVFALILSAVLLVGLVSACSSSDSGVTMEASVVPSDEVSEAPASDDASESASDDASAETAATSEEASSASGDASAAVSAEGEVLKRVIENGKLVMLTNATFPPYEYRGSDGNPVGVDVDLCQAIADQIGVELEVVDMEFDSLIPAMISGKGDIVAAGMTVTAERQEAVDFSETYADATQLIIVPVEGATVASEDDLAGKRIGVQLGTTGDLLASDLEGTEVSQYKSGLEAALDLKNGRIDAVVLDSLPAQNIVSQNEDLKTIDMSSTAEEQYAVAIEKGNEDFLEIINGVIEQLIADGSIEEMTSTHVQASTAG